MKNNVTSSRSLKKPNGHGGETMREFKRRVKRMPLSRLERTLDTIPREPRRHDKRGGEEHSSPPTFFLFYSYRNASIGAFCEAFRAG